MTSEPYFSQAGQDRFADEAVFRGMTGGVFVEIGASDGVTFSNTIFFERHRGWTGVCVEPVPARFEELRRNRTCVCLQGCVAARKGVASFRIADGCDMLSGIASASGRAPPAGGRIVEVPVFTPAEVFAAAGPRIDLCSIDTEGSELEILQAIDFSRWAPRFFTVEDNGRKFAILRRLYGHGYRLVARLGADLVFVDRALARSMPRSARLGIAGVIRGLAGSAVYRLRRPGAGARRP